MLLVRLRVVQSRPFPGDQEGGVAILSVEEGARDARVELTVDTDAALENFKAGALVDARFDAYIPPVAEPVSAEAVAQGDGDPGADSDQQ